MKYILSLVITTCVVGTMFAQFTIKGTVHDKAGNPLEFATVYLEDTKIAAATNSLGEFTLKGLEEDEYALVASYLGYDDYYAIIYVEEDITFPIVLEGSAFNLETIEIKGTWAGEKYPFAVSSLNEKALQEKNSVTDVPYLLQYMPSVVVSSDGGTGVGYTGIRVRGIDPTRINVTVNGIPLNDAESQSVYWVNMPDVMNSVSEVQIQRGVGTSTNGAGAFGATLNLNTNNVKTIAYSGIEAAYGSFDTRKLSVELGTGLLNDRFTLDGRYSLITSDGYVDRAKSALNSYFISGARISDQQSLRLNIFSGHEITYQAWYGLPVQYLDSNRTFNAAGYDNVFSKDEPYDNEIDNYRQNHVQLFWNKALRQGMNMDLAFHYTRGNGFFEQFKSGQSLADYGLNEDISSDLVRRKWLDNHFFGLVYNVQKSFEKSSLIVGGGLHDYIGRHFGEVDTVYNIAVHVPDNYLYYDNDANKLDFNTYAKYLHNIGDLILLADLQYRLVYYQFLGKNDNGEDLDQKLDLHFFNPKAGVTWSPDEHSELYTSFSVANREPNRDDYTESSPQSRPDPERLYNTELGYRFKSANLNMGLNLYYMNYKDQLVLTGKINDVGDYTKINIPKSYRAGVEMDVAWSFKNMLNIGASMTLSQNKIASFTEFLDDWDNGEQLSIEHENTAISFSPALIAGAEFKWNIIETFISDSDHKLEFAINNKFVGKQYLDNTMNETASLDPFNYTNGVLRYSFKKGWMKNLGLELRILNLFDQEYVSNGWVYRYKSAGYNPIQYDPYSVKSGEEAQYQMIGLFPQASRHYLFKVRLDF